MLVDKTGYRLAVCHYVELRHDLMGFFPAINPKTRRMIVASDRELMFRIWKTLPTCESKIGMFVCYVNYQKGVAFQWADEVWKQETSRPMQLVTRNQFAGLKRPPRFAWAPGLLSFRSYTPKEFAAAIVAARKVA